MTERLDKILSHQGFGTRKDVKKLLRSGLVTLNGKIVYDSAVHVDLEKDTLCYDGETVDVQGELYLMMNKAGGCVCSTREGERETVYDFIDFDLRQTHSGKKLHTMGRLDADTTGLLLITSDGELTHRLISPKNHVPKTYAVKLRDSTDEKQKTEYAQKLREGIQVPREQNEEGFLSESAELSWSTNEEGYDCELTVYEGKYHEVKRLFAALGNEVTALKRVSFACLSLDKKLAPGAYRELTEEELERLFAF
jgi:16S rRNA pseudouridine516 synthase